MSEITRVNNAHQAILYKKMDNDEKIVRNELVKVWTKILKKYAKPGAAIPDPEAMRRELIQAGTDAGVKRILDEHWFVFDFMVRPKVEGKIIEELKDFDLIGFIEEVRDVQQHPDHLNDLIEKIRSYVLI